ncbi:MATE family efflux transporter [Candidatus Doolittlea endobia]|uniref:Multidrug-efflux transporter n=1 Tax=Candidatus Doolittlea endobia TaxID=1778262 RepID=A0A143WSY2_9ENTR|nr:MATE family efflux transporter [Candidatus Doolittlea endobia]CUX96904.1 Multidrug resistance protein MdtK [Candidatus Doolittlea endobia]
MQNYIKEARILLALAIPVILTQVSQTAMGVVDTIMSGSVSPADMAAVAVGTSIWLPIILFGHGLLLALTPVIAQLKGSGRRECIAHQVHQSFWLALSTSLVIMILLYNSHRIIGYMHSVEPILAEKAVAFLRYLMWGAPGYLFFQVLRCQYEGLSRTIPGMVISFLGLVINIPINYIFIHGKLGIPALGGVGCGVATASVYWIMFLLLGAYTHRVNALRGFCLSSGWKKPDPVALKRLFILGLPVALALFFEVTLFALVALLIAPLGIVAVAGHQIALNFSSLMFVLPLSISVAATIRIGYRLGQGDVEQARISAWSSLMIGVTMACFTALFTSLLREHIALLYNDNPGVVSMASHLILLAAIYQISDSIQVIGSGVLRGYKDTRSIFFITFIAYWLLGLPCGYVLALTNWLRPAMGPSGFWFGFIIGLTFSAILMTCRMFWLQRQTSARILHRAAC